MTLRVGSHPNNLSLFILRRRGTLEALAATRGIAVQWTDYLAGGDSIDYLARNQLDVVGTGSTPPIHARAQGIEIDYLASSASRDANCALLVKRHSAITLPAQLRHVRIACMKGSFTDHFIARLINIHRLDASSIELVDLSGRDADAALTSGRVDAWAAIDPFLSAQLAQDDARVLATVGELIPNRSLFWARKDWVTAYPDRVALVQQALQENDLWIASHVAQAAEIMYKNMADPVSKPHLIKAIAARPWGISVADEVLLKEQQIQAADLFKAGFLPTPLNIFSRETS